MSESMWASIEEQERLTTLDGEEFFDYNPYKSDNNGKSIKVKISKKGGPGSGHHGHAGLPGVWGGSRPQGSQDVIDFEGLDRSQRDEILKDLKPSDTFKMYHGMSYLEDAYRTAKEGFDPSPEAHERHRIYARGPAARYEGYHLSPDIGVAKGFGRFVFELVTEAGKMVAPPATHWDTTAEEANEIWSENFPDSFRPALSASMLLGESQGLLIKPETRVQRVWMWSDERSEWYSMTPDEFVDKVESGEMRSYAQPGSELYRMGQGNKSLILPVKISKKGGPGSGHHGHAGLPGVWGGSRTRGVGAYRTFGSNEGAHRYAMEHLADSVEKHLSGVGDAIINYTKEDYLPINGYLRGKLDENELLKRQKRAIEALDKLMADEGSTVPEDIVVMRDFGYDFFEDKPAGTRFTDKGFVSTSVNPDPRGYLDAVAVQVPAGTRAAYIQPFAQVMHEGELLLDRGLVFEVVKNDAEGIVVRVVETAS